MPPKKEMSQSNKEQFLAEMTVKAACSFAHLGLTLDDIGIPPLTADKKTCSGHSWKDFCATCRFNYCWKCGNGGDTFSSLHRRRIATCWTGLCGIMHDEAAVPSREHHARVLELAKQMMGEEMGNAEEAGQEEEVTHKRKKDSKERSLPVAQASIASSKERSLPVAQASIASSKARSLPVAQASIASAAAVFAPQINIAIAPLAQVQVESTNTVVRRVADGAMGNTRFEVTVRVVLEQVVVGQQV